jgi:transposase InsO family protein
MEQQRTIVAECTPTAGSERRACRWMGFHRSAVRYVPHRPDEHALRQGLRELAEEHPRWGRPRLIWRLRQEGVRDNHKRLRRLYRLEGLAVRRRRRKRVAVLERLSATRGLPRTIVVDNGPEFQSRALDAWAHHRHVQLQFIRPPSLHRELQR